MDKQLTVQELEQKANDIRKDIIDMLTAAGSGHSAGSLDMADIFSVLYFRTMKLDPQNPEWDGRDVLFLSNGHTVPVQYAAMAERGYFDKAELKTLRKLGSRLQGHPERESLPGMESTSGPLGSGLSQAAGYAYDLQYLEADYQKVKERFVYVTMGDGELDEGNIWEAAMFAGKYKLGHLIGIVDRNNIQIDGTTEEVMPLDSLRDKWEAFGWHVIEADGNSVSGMIEAFNLAKAVTNRPVVILAYTVPGKGVDFMEYDFKWHGVAPNNDQARQALEKLRTLDGRITYEGIE